MKSLLVKHSFRPLIVAMTTILVTPIAMAVDISNKPLFLGGAGTKNSNVFFVLDDSGSMGWSVLRSKGAQKLDPDWTGQVHSISFNANSSNDIQRRTLCYGFNVMAYNPNVVYTPWEGVNDAGVPYPQADIYHLHINYYSNPYKSNSSTKSAINDVYLPWNDLDNDGEYDYGECLQQDSNGNSIRFRPRQKKQCRKRGSQWCQVVKDLPVTSSTTTNTRQNYANWHEYYFRRSLTMKRALSSIINNLEANAGLDTINRNNASKRGGKKAPTLISDIRINANKAALMKALFTMSDNGGTPLRRALKEAGKYFTEATEPGEIAASPITEQVAQCQGNYAVLFTDGFWNGGTPNNKGWGASYDGVPIGNEDGDNNTDFDGNAHADNQSSTLADVAMKYYENDLVPSLANEGFITKGVDENKAQHMVTYTISFGAEASLSSSPGFGDSNFTWPEVHSNSISTLDDLRHAAYNGRGLYLSAKDPSGLVKSFQNIMYDIAQRDASSAALGSSTSEIQVGTALFQGTLNSRYWSGDITSFSLDNNNAVNINHPIWKASQQLPSYNNRVIITSIGSGTSTEGKAFRWGDLPGNLKLGIDNEKSLNYIRGDETHEQAQSGDQSFRDRPIGKLGDFVNSKPVYLAGSVPHVFAGANDGMLHAFNAATGVETFAYIPSAVYGNLSDLASPTYTHRFYVDGTVSITHTDAETILVGGLNAGGYGIYALDVSDMSSGFSSENVAKNKVLWEFTRNSDSELGLTFSRPQVIKLNSGVWAAVFGNGYNSTGNSILYVVNASTGALIRKIDTGAGIGLSTVKPFDSNGDGNIDSIYAGDLSGNLWKFDLTGGSSAWSSDLLFTSDTDQAITAQPQVIKHPSQSGYMVYFGTGKYIGGTDSSNTSVQSFYGIWDDESGTQVQKSELRQRKILADNIAITGTNFSARVTSAVNDAPTDGGGEVNWTGTGGGTVEKGWYLNFDTLSGERVITEALVRNNQIIFTTMIPSVGQACAAGGESLLMGLDLEQGARRPSGFFDTNGDGNFDKADKVLVKGKLMTVTGINLSTGITASPLILDNLDTTSVAYVNGTQGQETIGLIGNASPSSVGKRKSWRQIFL